MELAQSFLLNEAALAQLPELKKPVFVYEWLRFLERVLAAAQKSDVKEHQTKLVDQLMNQIVSGPGPPTRQLLARCLATLFSVGDTFALFGTINACNDILKSKDDSPSYLPTRLAAVACIGAMYEKLGRMVGRSFEETTQILLRALKGAESQGRTEIMETFEKMVAGLGNAGSSVHRDIYKAARTCLTDRVMAARAAAAKCLLAMVKEATFLYTTELDSVTAACFKALEGSNYEVRCEVGRLIGIVCAAAHDPTTTIAPSTGMKVPTAMQNMKVQTAEECLQMMATGFLKGGSSFLKEQRNIPREIRTGVAFAYVHFARALGNKWLERNLTLFIRHVLDIASNPKCHGTQLEAIFSRRCVCYILRKTLGEQLSEKAQHTAAKELGQFIAEQTSTMDISMEGSLDDRCTPDLQSNQHALVCTLQELASLVQQLDTSVAPLFTEASGIMEPVFSVLLHPCLPARLAAAWCLRCVSVAVPSLVTPLIDRCLNRLEHMKGHPDALSGYSSALAGLLGGMSRCRQGIPLMKGKQVFAAGEDLLKGAGQSTNLTLARTQAGWMLISAVMALGSAVVRTLLPRCLNLWKNAFPRTAKEAEAELQRGDAFTWQVTLEARSGAFCAIHRFLGYCKDLATDDVLRRVMAALDAALSMLAHCPQVVKQYGASLRAAASNVRYHMYCTALLVKPKNFEGSFAQLLRELVAEFTLTDNTSVLTVSLLRELCHHDDRVILGSWLQDTDHRMIEEQMEPNRKAEFVVLQPFNASACGALEHDPSVLCSRSAATAASCCDVEVPSPLPMAVAVLDASVRLFGHMFPLVPAKHRLQMLEHFEECVKQAKGVRQQAVQINIFAALLCSLKQLAEQKGSFETDGVRKAALTLILSNLGANNAVLRCAAAEALGRVAQVVGDPRFVAELAQHCFDKLKGCRDVISRTGYSLSLGCLHRYVGGLGSGQHLNTSISILLALSQDTTSSVVQVWALHALGLIADSGGPMFRGYVEPSLSLCLKILLSVTATHPDLHQSIGKLCSALVTTVGPELQNNIGAIVATRSSFVAACAIMMEHEDPLVRAEAISCLQQLHMFAPRHVNLASVVPVLCAMCSNSHLILRRAAVACLRQLAQREAREVFEHAQAGFIREQGSSTQKAGSHATDANLQSMLFALLDVETDGPLRENAKETITSLTQCLAAEQLTDWLNLCRGILAASATDSTNPQEEAGAGVTAADEFDDDTLRMGTGEPESASRNQVLPRWPTRVFAMETVRRIIVVCENERAHFDLALAKELQYSTNVGDYLVLHLSELVRVAFMGATSDSTDLRLAGLAALQDIIARFAKVPEPEFPGHVILEQFQAQVGAALRPAFSPETPANVTAAACDVCSAWIGSGVARDLNDLRRVHQLLVSSLAKLNKGSMSTQLYSESAATLEKLAILKAWAEVYIIAMRQDADSKTTSSDEQPPTAESLLNLVVPELSTLIGHWLAALKDYALLTLPAEYAEQLPAHGGAYYIKESVDTVRPYYRQAWASILLAATTWLSRSEFELPPAAESIEKGDAPISNGLSSTNGPDMDTKEKRFFLIMGTCMEALFSARHTESPENVQLCLEALRTMLECDYAQRRLMNSCQLSIELLNVMHRIILTRESLHLQSLSMEVLEQVLTAAEKQMQRIASATNNNEEKGQEDGSTNAATGYQAQEGNHSGVIEPGKSLVFAVLEVCLCCLVRQIPQVNPATAKSGRGAFLAHRKYSRLSAEAQALIGRALQALVRLPALCSDQGTLAILPTILLLVIGSLRETSQIERSQFVGDLSGGTVSPPAATAIQCLRQLASKPIYLAPGDNHDSSASCERMLSSEWVTLMQQAIWSLLDLVATKDEQPMIVDRVPLLLSLAVFLISAPRDVVLAPNLSAACVEFLKQSLQSEQLVVQQKTLQTLQSIFSVKDRNVAAVFIVALGPRVFERLETISKAESFSDSEVQVYLEAQKCVELLVSAAEASKKQTMISMALRALMLFVELDSKAAKPLKEQTLQRITKLATQYPEQFRALLQQAPGTRSKLEDALASANVARAGDKAKAKAAAQGETPNGKERPAQPAIKLTMDFSNFTRN